MTRPSGGRRHIVHGGPPVQKECALCPPALQAKDLARRGLLAAGAGADAVALDAWDTSYYHNQVGESLQGGGEESFLARRSLRVSSCVS